MASKTDYASGSDNMAYRSHMPITVRLRLLQDKERNTIRGSVGLQLNPNFFGHNGLR